MQKKQVVNTRFSEGKWELFFLESPFNSELYGVLQFEKTFKK